MENYYYREEEDDERTLYEGSDEEMEEEEEEEQQPPFRTQWFHAWNQNFEQLRRFYSVELATLEEIIQNINKMKELKPMVKNLEDRASSFGKRRLYFKYKNLKYETKNLIHSLSIPVSNMQPILRNLYIILGHELFNLNSNSLNIKI